MSSLWWTKKEQLDTDQIKLIEDLSLHSDALVLGAPGVWQNECSCEAGAVCPGPKSAEHSRPHFYQSVDRVR